MFTIFALLFVGQAVHVAYEDQTGSVQVFTVQNNDEGATELGTRLAPPLASAPGKPLVCMSAAAGSSLQGALFERAIFNDSVRRFMYAQPKYLLDSKALGSASTDPKTLLHVCAATFPSAKASGPR
jgi:hypothetical protein